jgi:hypothetical protein
MKVKASLMQGRTTVDSYSFDVEKADDFRRGASKAYSQFRRLHPEVRMFNPGVIVEFGRGD